MYLKSVFPNYYAVIYIQQGQNPTLLEKFVSETPYNNNKHELLNCCYSADMPL